MKNKILILCFLIFGITAFGQITPITPGNKFRIVGNSFYFNLSKDTVWRLRVNSAGDSLIINNKQIYIGGGGGGVQLWEYDTDSAIINNNSNGTVKIANLPLYKTVPAYFVTSYDSTNNRLTKYPVTALINGDTIVDDTAGIDVGCTGLTIYSLADSTRWQHSYILDSITGDTLGCVWVDVSGEPILPDYWSRVKGVNRHIIYVTDVTDSVGIGKSIATVKLDVNGKIQALGTTGNIINSTATTGVAVQGTATGAGTGVRGTSANIGVSGTTTGTSAYAAGVYGASPKGWAGYFNNETRIDTLHIISKLVGTSDSLLIREGNVVKYKKVTIPTVTTFRDSTFKTATVNSAIVVYPYVAKKGTDPVYPYFYGGSSAPTFRNRINLDGWLYGTKVTLADTSFNSCILNVTNTGLTNNAGGIYSISTNGTGIGGASTNWRGVSGSSVSSTGVFGYSTNGIGGSFSSSNSYGISCSSDNYYGIKVHGYTASYAAIWGMLQLTTTNTVNEVMKVERITTGTASAGIGASIGYYVENGSNISINTNIISARLSRVLNGHESSSFDFYTEKNGFLTKKMELDSSGYVVLPYMGNASGDADSAVWRDYSTGMLKMKKLGAGTSTDTSLLVHKYVTTPAPYKDTIPYIHNGVWYKDAFVGGSSDSSWTRDYSLNRHWLYPNNVDDSVFLGQSTGSHRLDVNGDIWSFNSASTAINGTSGSGNGIYGSSTAVDGVYGNSDYGSGVYGISQNSYGVTGYSPNNIGIKGSSDTYIGISGYSPVSYGVYGHSHTGHAGYFQGRLYADTIQMSSKFSIIASGTADSCIYFDRADSTLKIKRIGSGGVSDSSWTRNYANNQHWLFPNSPDDSVHIGGASPTERLEVSGNIKGDTTKQNVASFNTRKSELIYNQAGEGNMFVVAADSGRNYLKFADDPEGYTYQLFAGKSISDPHTSITGYGSLGTMSTEINNTGSNYDVTAKFDTAGFYLYGTGVKNIGRAGSPIDTVFSTNLNLSNLSGSGTVLGIDGSNNVVKTTGGGGNDSTYLKATSPIKLDSAGNTYTVAINTDTLTSWWTKQNKGVTAYNWGDWSGQGFMTNPMDSEGDMIFRDVSGTQKLAAGEARTFLRMKSDGTIPEWDTTANASTNSRGLLTSTDWNTFYNKQSSLGFTPVNRADSVNPTAGSYASNYDMVTGLAAKAPDSLWHNVSGTYGAAQNFTFTGTQTDLTKYTRSLFSCLTTEYTSGASSVTDYIVWDRTTIGKIPRVGDAIWFTSGTLPTASPALSINRAYYVAAVKLHTGAEKDSVKISENPSATTVGSLVAIDLTAAGSAPKYKVQKVGYVDSLTISTTTITAYVVTDTILASGDNNFKISNTNKVYDFQEYWQTGSVEVVADASNPQGRRILDTKQATYLLPVNSAVGTAATGSGACAWNVYYGTTNMFTTAPDLGVALTLNYQRPSVKFIQKAQNLTIRVTNVAGTIKPQYLQLQMYLIPVFKYTAP